MHRTRGRFHPPDRTDAINLSIIISNISPWAYIRGSLYSSGFFVNKSLGLYARGLIIEGAYTPDFTISGCQAAIWGKSGKKWIDFGEKSG